MKISLLKDGIGREAKNKITKAREKTKEGAIACLETFYYSCNNKDIDTLRSIWYLDSLIQLNNPQSGLVRGIQAIEDLYHKIFERPFAIWVKFTDVVCYCSEEIVVFSGTEISEFSNEYETIPIEILTTRVFAYSKNDEQWCQLHHQGSMDDLDLQYRYQNSTNNRLALGIEDLD
jgi:hypothetical protein